MDMELNIQITGLTIEVTPVIREDNIKAFVNWTFITDSGEWKVKNGTIRIKEFGAVKKLSYDVPAIKGKIRYNKTLFIDNLDLYKQFCKATIDKYVSLTGELPNDVSYEEEVNIDDLPKDL